MSKASKIGSMAVKAQRLGFDGLAHKLIDTAIARAPLGDALDELSAVLGSIGFDNPQFNLAVELQTLIDEYRREQ